MIRYSEQLEIYVYFISILNYFDMIKEVTSGNQWEIGFKSASFFHTGRDFL